MRIIALLSLALSLGQIAWAQKDAASIVGTVRDPSGAVVPGAQVTATDVDRGTSFVTSTDGSGNYVAGPLKIGHYTVKVSKKDFETLVIGPFALQVGQRREVNAKLEIGEVIQKMNVSAAPSLETQTSDLGQVIDNRTIKDLPLNGRNFGQLALLAAGVAPSEPGAANEDTFGFSANGARSYQNNYLLDGIDNNSNITDLQTGASYAIQPSVDAVEEFKVQTNGYSAEFGRGNGAVLNATIKSGTNGFHGAVFEFLRNDKFDARNFFEQKRGAYQRNQFGATLGGPVVIPHLYDGRNRSFFFVDYEGLRIRQERPLQATVPTLAMRSGDFSDLIDYTTDEGVTDCNGQPTFAGELFNTRLTRHRKGEEGSLCGVPFGYDASGKPVNIIPSGLFDPLAVNLLKLWPLPNVTGNAAFNYLTEPKVQENQNNLDIRFDHTVSEKDSGFARYSYQVQPSTHPAVFQATGGGGNEGSAGFDHNFATSVALSENHIFNPHSGNEGRLGYNRIDARHLQQNFNRNLAAELGISGVPFGPLNGGLPLLDFSDVDSIGTPLSLPSIQVQNTYDFSDNVTLTRGKHSLKFGTEIRREEFTIKQPIASRGHLNFGTTFTDNPGNPANPGTGGSGFASFLIGLPDFGEMTSVHNVDYQRPVYAFYIQDNYKVAPNLTLNLGLRYDLFATIKERLNQQGTYDMNTQTLLVPRGQNAQLTPKLAKLIPVSATAGRGLVPVDADNFAPRVGFAYKFNDRVVLRSSYGIFYAGYESGGWANPSSGFNPPFSQAQSFQMPCATPSANPANEQEDCSIPGFSHFSNGFPLDSLSDPSLPQLFGLDANLRSPYMQQWQLSTQYRLPFDTVLEIAYSGSKGTRLYSFYNANQAAPSAKQNDPTMHRRPIPAIDTAIFQLKSNGNSEYNSLQVRVERRFSRGLGALMTYTYGHSLDNSSSVNLQSRNFSDFRWSTHPEWEHGNSDFDVRHRFVLSYIYELPFGRGRRFEARNEAINQIVGGWQISGVASLTSGSWFTILDSNSNFAQSDGSQRPDTVANPNGRPCLPGTLFNTCAFVDPPLGSFGNTGKNTVLGPNFRNWDLSVIKNFALPKSTSLQFRAEFFNLLNHTTLSFNNVATDLASAERFGFPDQARNPREVQFALKFYY